MSSQALERHGLGAAVQGVVYDLLWAQGPDALRAWQPDPELGGLVSDIGPQGALAPR